MASILESQQGLTDRWARMLKGWCHWKLSIWMRNTSIEDLTARKCSKLREQVATINHFIQLGWTWRGALYTKNLSSVVTSIHPSTLTTTKAMIVSFEFDVFPLVGIAGIAQSHEFMQASLATKSSNWVRYLQLWSLSITITLLWQFCNVHSLNLAPNSSAVLRWMK